MGIRAGKASAKASKAAKAHKAKAPAKGAAKTTAKATVKAAKPAKAPAKAPIVTKGKASVPPSKTKGAAPAAKAPKATAAKEVLKTAKGAKGTAAKAPVVVIEKPAKEAKALRGKKGAILSPEALSASAALRKVKGQTEGVAAAALAAHEAAGDQVCREVACEGLATTSGYCRLHYIKNWRKIKRKELILKEGKLNQYIEELVAKYPDKYIDAIKQDLASEKEFAKIIYDLDLDGSVDEFDIEGENDEDIIDDIKREIDDDTETGF